ncbi:MAG TPA: hypothetical protein ENI33_04330 [Thermoplasmatales archaeon]|nr:hypothetical protein [Thermoplasmatales archaeon]
MRLNNGKYKIKVAEELDETSYIDKLSLVVAEHSNNVKVYPDFYNNLHTIKNPIEPVVAIDSDGNDCMELMQKDNVYWFAYPDFEKLQDDDGDGIVDSCNESDFYKWLELEYPKPENTTQAKILYRAKETSFEIAGWTTLLETLGKNNLNILRDVYNEELVQWLVSQMMSVEIWNGSSWIEVHRTLEATASTKGNNVVLPVNLSGIDTDILKIRFKTIVGMQGLDYAWVDYSEDEEINVTEVYPMAISKGNVEKVLYNDSDYLTLERGDDVFIEFPEIPNPENNSRTYLIKDDGYYFYNFDNNVEYTPEIDALLNQVFNDTLFATRYFMPKFYSYYSNHNTIYTDYVKVIVAEPKVTNLNTGEEFDTIQDAIDAVNTTDGHTLKVDFGGYRENVVINKSLKIIGDPIIDAHNGTGIEIEANDVLIQNMTIYNGTHGIYANSSFYIHNITISNCTIYNNFVGIYFGKVNDSKIIDGCHIYWNGYSEWNEGGIGLAYSHYNLIDNITCDENYADDIFLFNSSNNTINNTILQNDEGKNGIYLWNSDYNKITNNTIRWNADDGIYMGESNYTTIKKNKIYDNNYGINLEHGEFNSIKENDIFNNSRGIYIWSSCLNNTINYNNIYNNTNYGIFSDAIVDAQFNWWGNETGPGGDAGGNGDAINDVDKIDYSPWLGYSWHHIPMTWYTNDDIQDVIDVASAYDTLKVYPGIYYENVVVDKPLKIIGDPFIDAHGGIGIKIEANDTLVENMTIYNGTYGIYAHNDSFYIHNVTISNCTVYNNSWHGIYIWNVNNSKIIDSYIDKNGQSPGNVGIYLEYSHYNFIDNITCNNSYWNEIFLWESDNNVINHSIIQNNRWWDGIKLGDSDYNKIINNTIRWNAYAGIYASGSFRNFIYKNEIYENGNDGGGGISISWDCGYNIIKKNRIHDNIHNGTNLIGGYSIIEENDIFNHSTGISVSEYSLNNTIHYNNIYNNTDYGIFSNAVVNATLNYWGNATGPYDPYGSIEVPPWTGDFMNESNLDGAGCNVSNNTDYTPWLNSRLDYGLVHNIDNDSYYGSIQPAVNDASPYNTLKVYPGIYYENVVIDKPLTIIGDPAIDAHNGIGISIEADDTLIENITIYNGTVGIYVHNDTYTVYGVTLRNCTVHNNSEHGIYFWDVVYSIINKCHVYENGWNAWAGGGICLSYSDNNLIEDVMCNDNGVDEIYLRSSNNNTINNTTIQSGGINGISLYKTYYNNITNNTIRWNTNGIRLDYYSNYTIIEENNIFDNERGIYIHFSCVNNTINYNNIYNNTKYGIFSDAVVNAQYNWWENESGPYNETTHSEGKGENISVNVDYSPWLGYSWPHIPMTWHTNDVIQDAIDAASAYDTVKVYPGIYHENVVIDKPLKIIGDPFIDAHGGGGIIIEANDTLIQNITVYNGTIGIFIHNYSFYLNNITISNCTVHDNSIQGIYIWNVTHSKIIDGCYIYGNGWNLPAEGTGIYLNSSYHNLIENITCDGNYYDGIHLFHSNDNIINNTILQNDVHFEGIWVNDSSYNIITNNTIRWNAYDGIYMDGASSYNFIYNNTIYENGASKKEGGISIRGNCFHNIIRKNRIFNNIGNGISFWGNSSYVIVEDNEIYNNSIGIYVNNTFGSGNISIEEIPFRWVNVSSFDVIVRADNWYTNYTLPFTFPFMGRSIVNITANTNGLIELLEEGESCYEYDDYGTHYDGDHIGNMDAIFASNDDLVTDSSPSDYLGIADMGNKVVIEWYGSTYEDYNSSSNLIHFQIVLYPDGTVEWNFKTMNFSDYEYDMFSGAYAKEENIEFIAGYAIGYQTSFRYNFSSLSLPPVNNIRRNNITEGVIGIQLENSLFFNVSYNILWNSEWDIIVSNCSNNLFLENTFSKNYPTKASFTFSGNLSAKGVESPPSPPAGYTDFGKYINITCDKWVNLSIYYNSSMNETLFKIWKWNGTWYEDGWNGTRYLDTARDIIGVNITNCGDPIFAPLTDGEPPATTITLGSPHFNNYITSYTPINLTAYDNLTGVNKTYYRLWWLHDSIWENITGVIEYAGNFTFADFSHTQECNHRIEYWSVDYAGNVEAHNNKTVYVDNSPPQTSIVDISIPVIEKATGTYITTTSVITIDATDQGACKIGSYRIEYRILIWNGSWNVVHNWTWGTWNSSISFNFTEGCRHKLEYRAIDGLYNIEGIKSKEFYVDVYPPNSTLSLSQPKYTYDNKTFVTENTTFYLSAVDEGEYGCAVGPKQVYYRIWYNGSWSNWKTEGTSTATFSLTGECMHIIQYYGIDELGNNEGYKEMTVYVDVTPPSTNLSIGEPKYSNFVTSHTPVWLNATDEGCNGGAGVAASLYNYMEWSAHAICYI